VDQPVAHDLDLAGEEHLEAVELGPAGFEHVRKSAREGLERRSVVEVHFESELLKGRRDEGRPLQGASTWAVDIAKDLELGQRRQLPHQAQRLDLRLWGEVMLHPFDFKL
jgi:hypothetical protein